MPDPGHFIKKAALRRAGKAASLSRVLE